MSTSKTRQRFFQIEGAHTLVLEDDQIERVACFRARLPQAVIVRNPGIAILALQNRIYKYVFLDYNVPDPNNLDGLCVAQFLAETKFSGRVIVHSANTEAAFLMGKVLRHAGVTVAVSEFGNFEIERER